MNAQEKERQEEIRFLAQPTTPKSERRWNANGMIGMSLQTVGGLCPLPRCVRKSDHAGDCWPTTRS
jgi:hypothetical protein